MTSLKDYSKGWRILRGRETIIEKIERNPDHILGIILILIEIFPIVFNPKL